MQRIYIQQKTILSIFAGLQVGLFVSLQFSAVTETVLQGPDVVVILYRSSSYRALPPFKSTSSSFVHVNRPVLSNSMNPPHQCVLSPIFHIITVLNLVHIIFVIDFLPGFIFSGKHHPYITQVRLFHAELHKQTSKSKTAIYLLPKHDKEQKNNIAYIVLIPNTKQCYQRLSGVG